MGIIPALVTLAERCPDCGGPHGKSSDLCPRPRDTLAVIERLRAMGATSIEVNGVKVTFPAASSTPAQPADPVEVAAAQEKAERLRRQKARSLDDRLFDPLGIGKKERES